MLFVLFSIKGERFVIDAASIVEIIPQVEWIRVADAPPHVAGVINYRGRPVPIIDLCSLLAASPCSRRHSSRILLLDHPGETGQGRLYGLLAEQIIETRKYPASGREKFFLPPPASAEAEGEPLQRFDCKRFVPKNVLADAFALVDE
ncbi:MAG: chemotaxis protein CheW [Thermodesulfobacteriota bacterium]